MKIAVVNRAIGQGMKSREKRTSAEGETGLQEDEVTFGTFRKLGFPQSAKWIPNAAMIQESRE